MELLNFLDLGVPTC